MQMTYFLCPLRDGGRTHRTRLRGRYVDHERINQGQMDTRVERTVDRSTMRSRPSTGKPAATACGWYQRTYSSRARRAVRRLLGPGTAGLSR